MAGVPKGLPGRAIGNAGMRPGGTWESEGPGVRWCRLRVAAMNTLPWRTPALTPVGLFPRYA
jgi:hypothetical protein